LSRTVALLVGFGLLGAGAAGAATLTAEDAVRVALQRNAQIIGADASVLDARGGVYGAMSGLLPSVRGTVSRFNTIVDKSQGSGVELVAGAPAQPYSTTVDREAHGTTPSVSGTWPVLNLANWSDYSSARNALTAARHGRQATRNDIALEARRQFYEVVKTVRLADVASGALRLARDDERRVRALFEVGSVSKSDLLKAQVRTAQSELDSLTAHQATVNQRILLAELLGVKESEMGAVDTVLAVQPQSYDEGSLLAQASRSRPDLMAAEKDLSAARAALNAARFARLPYITANGTMQLNTSSRDVQTLNGFILPSFRNETDRAITASIAVNWDVFDGLATDSRIASARARVMRAEQARTALQRNLQSEVLQALLSYREAVERARVAGRATESAAENLKLTQEKYNVGSATILELIDAQVQLQRAQSDGVSAQAAIHVAQAQIDRVRGRAE
jgi:outer membrane protein